jgi:hypothetical protein
MDDESGKICAGSCSADDCSVPPQFISCGTRRDGSEILVFPDDPSINAAGGAPDGPGLEMEPMLISPAAAQLAERRERLRVNQRDGSPTREINWDEMQVPYF